ncbi:MAG TPA: DUF4440 domain-containing protein [Caulobacteraceae bacterium]
MRPILAAALAMALAGGAAAGAAAQTVPPPAESRDHASARAFMDAYAQDLRNTDREAVIGRYDPAGVWFVGGGQGEWLRPAQIAENYRSEAWRPPADFAFQDLAFVTAGDDVVTVTGRFNWPRPDGSARAIAYHGLLVRIDGQWRIRVEDETPVLNIR